MNTYQKGMRTVKKGRKLLESEGWLTGDVEQRSKMGKQDLFGIGDVIAIKPGRTKLIQFKTNSMPSIKPYEEFQKKYPQFEVEVWIYFDYKGFKIIKLPEREINWILNKSKEKL